MAKKNYQAWTINESDFPSKGKLEDKLKFLINYGVLAPSTHNTQPWLFEVSKNILKISPNQKLKLKIADPNNMGLYVSLGACAENICSAAEIFGFKTKITIKSADIEIIFTENADKAATRTLQAIKARHSNKFAYINKTIDEDILARLAGIKAKTVDINIVGKDELRGAIHDLHTEAASHAASNKEFVFELTSWLRNNPTRATNGMPGFVTGNSTLKSLVGKLILKRKPELLLQAIKQDKILLESSSAIVVFSAKHDSIDNWVQVGRTVEEFWLGLTEHGLVGHPMAAIIQHGQSRKTLAKLLSTDSHPVFLMRIGYSKGKHLHTPRKKV